jgi:hypothetical protein
MSQKNNELPAPRLTASSAERARKERGTESGDTRKEPHPCPIKEQYRKKAEFS